MRIGIIGAGHIGGTLAGLFTKAGHEVAVANSRGPETLADLVQQLGPGAHATTPADAATWGEVVVVSVPLHSYRDVPGEGLDGKVVIDTNNYYPQRDGQIRELDDDSTTSSELLAAHLPRPASSKRSIRSSGNPCVTTARRPARLTASRSRSPATTLTRSRPSAGSSTRSASTRSTWAASPRAGCSSPARSSTDPRQWRRSPRS